MMDDNDSQEQKTQPPQQQSHAYRTLVFNYGAVPQTNQDEANVTSPVGISGDFIRLARAGKLSALGPLFLEYQTVASKLHRVEEKLVGCNTPAALAEFANGCAKRGKNFETELRRFAEQLESEKGQLRDQLTKIRQEIVAEEPAVANWQNLSQIESSRLLLREPRHSVSNQNPAVASRYAALDKYLGLGRPDWKIWELLDVEFSRERPPRELPESWVEKFAVKTFKEAYRNSKCRPLLHTLISKRRSRLRLPVKS